MQNRASLFEAPWAIVQLSTQPSTSSLAIVKYALCLACSTIRVLMVIFWDRSDLHLYLNQLYTQRILNLLSSSLAKTAYEHFVRGPINQLPVLNHLHLPSNRHQVVSSHESVVLFGIIATIATLQPSLFETTIIIVLKPCSYSKEIQNFIFQLGCRNIGCSLVWAKCFLG